MISGAAAISAVTAHSRRKSDLVDVATIARWSVTRPSWPWTGRRSSPPPSRRRDREYNRCVTLFEHLDFIYMPSRDVAADVKYFTEVLGADADVRRRRHGHARRDARDNRGPATPPPGRAPRRRSARHALPGGRHQAGNADTRSARLEARAHPRDPARARELLRDPRWPSARDLSAHSPGGRRALRRPARLSRPTVRLRFRQALRLSSNSPALDRFDVYRLRIYLIASVTDTVRRHGEEQQDAPLTPAVLHILLALSTEERHGYGIMKQVERESQGKVKMGPGTLYGSLGRMMTAGLIRESDNRVDPAMDDERRIYYQITGVGRKALKPSWTDTATSSRSPPRSTSPRTPSPMASDRSIRRYRRWYSRLLRLYPRPFRIGSANRWRRPSPTLHANGPMRTAASTPSPSRRSPRPPQRS